MRDKIMDIMPEMKTGKELLDCLRETPEYPACIWEKNSMERLVALSDIYNVYIPSRMSVEIYHKLYMGLLRSMQKKESMQAVYQKYGVSATGSCVQLAIQMPILFALYQVIQNIPAYVGSVYNVFNGVCTKILAVDGFTDIINNFITDNKMTRVRQVTENADSIVDFLYALSPSQWESLQKISQFSGFSD